MSNQLLSLNETTVYPPVDIANLQAVVAGFSGVILQVDNNRRVLWGNKESYELQTTVIGETCCDVLEIDINDCGKCLVADSMTTGEVQVGVREGNLRHDKGVGFAIYEVTSSPIIRDNIVDGAMVMVVNITERYHLEKRVRLNQKMEAVGTLARGISHDFNNILTPIIGYSEIIRLRMQQKEIVDETIDEYLNEILVASRRAQGLVEQMLRCSSTAQKNIAITHLHEILEQNADLMRTMLPSTIRVITQIDEDCGRISIDESHLQQILMNLCHNSITAIGDNHGEVSLSLEALPVDVSGKEWVKISFADTGCGIEKSLLDRVFEPYFTTQEKECGTGMGLAVVHGLVHSQKGYVRVQSEVGIGTTFELYFPVVDTVAKAEHVVSIPGLTMGQGNVLFVDDDEQVVEVAIELLQTLGYKVTGFSSSRKALAHFLKNPEGFDVLITDLTMPGLTGVELCVEVKKISPDFPVILCTGYSEKLTVEVLEQVGVNRYCLKPLALKEFASVIAEVLA